MGLTGALGCLTGFSLPALCYAHFCAPPPRQLAFARAVAVFGGVSTLWSFAQQVVALT